MLASSRIAHAVGGRRRPPPLGLDRRRRAGDRRRCARRARAPPSSGSTISSLAVPSMTTSCPAWTSSARVVQADDRRHFERAREDRGVIGAAAGVGGEAADLRPVDLRRERRRQLVGDQHRRLVELAQQVARRRDALAQVHPQPADQIGDVALALAQVRIGDLVEDRAELVEHLLHRPLGVDALLADDARRRAAPASDRRASAAARRTAHASSRPRRRATRARMSTQLLARPRAALLEPRRARARRAPARSDSAAPARAGSGSPRGRATTPGETPMPVRRCMRPLRSRLRRARPARRPPRCSSRRRP